MNLVDIIEKHIKAMLEQSDDNVIMLRRNELAQNFGCAPSQINYVIHTRFSLERGYVTESQRGGGGYVRIIRLDLDDISELLPLMEELSRDGLNQRQALDIIAWLHEQDVITRRELRMMHAVVDRAVLDVPLPIRDKMRARLLAAMVAAIIRDRG